MHVPIRPLARVADTKSVLVSCYFNDLFTGYVSVPASLSNNVFLLDFESQLKTIIDAEKEESAAKLDQIINLIVSTYDKLDPSDVVDKIMAMGIKINKEILQDKKGRIKDPNASRGVTERSIMLDFVDKMQSKMTSITTESGMSNLLIKDILTDKRAPLKIDAIQEAGLSQVADVVEITQKFYAKFLNMERGDELGVYLNEFMNQNPILKTALALTKILRSGQGAYVQARESYVLDELFKQIHGTPLVTKTELIKGKFYTIDSTKFTEVSFADAVAAFMWSLSRMMGLDPSSEDVLKVSLQEMVGQVITGVGQNLPFAPTDAGVIDQKNMQDNYMLVYQLHLYRRLLKDDAGDFKNRVVNAIKTNRFWKLEEGEYMFNENLYVLSAAFESFRDTAFYFREMYKRTDLLYKNWQSNALHPLKLKRVRDFIEDQISKFSTFDQASDHPAYYKMAGHITQHTVSSIVGSSLNIDYSFAKRDKFKVPPFIIGDKMEQFVRIFSAGLLSGSWWDLNDGSLPRSIRVINAAPLLTPVYSFSIPISDPLLNTSVVRYLNSIYPLRTISSLRLTNPDIWDDIMRRGQLMSFSSPEDLSMVMGMPLEIAEKLYERQEDGDLFIDLSAVTGMTFFFSADIYPIYEMALLSTDRYVPPFVAKFPALDEEISNSYSLVSNATDDMFTKLEKNDRISKKKKEQAARAKDIKDE